MSLNLPTEDYVLMGSPILYLKGIVDDIHDLDIVARGKAWEAALEKGKRETAMSGDEKVNFFNEDIEVFPGWFKSKFPGEFDTDELIENATIVDGVRVASLLDVLRWLEILDKEKYQKRARLVRKYLNNKLK